MSIHNLPVLAVSTAALLFASTAMAQESVTTDGGTINREQVSRFFNQPGLLALCRA
jgi:hypothetical protein